MWSRREMLCRSGGGFGALALAWLLQRDSKLRAFDPTPAPADPLAVREPHFPAKAERVISLFMDGGPSHLDLYDYKPELAKWNGKLPPADLLQGYRAAFINPNSSLLGPKFKFAKQGQCGAEISELLPHLAEVRVVRSVCV